LNIIKTNIEYDKEWNEFLDNHYDMFFDFNFLNYNDHFNKNLIWHHLKIKDSRKNKIIAILIGCEQIKEGKRIFISCNGVSFGGFRWKDKTGLIEMMETIDSVISYLKNEGFDECILRDPPLIYHNLFNEEYEYALYYKGFDVVNYSITNVISLEDFSFEKLANPKKRSIHKSESKIEIESLDSELEYDSFKDYYKVLLENRLRKNVTPTHSMEELIYLKNKLGNKIKIFASRLDGIITGICILFAVQKDIILNFYLADDENYKKDRISDFLLYKSIEWAKNNNFRLYDIGTSNVRNDFLPGLFDFKKKFLANGFLRKTFKLNLK
jgi:hypothetical protein